MRRILFVMCLLTLALLLILPSSEGFAQKKAAKDQPAGAQTVKPGAPFKEWLAQHVGKPSNHGTLVKVGPDYVVFEEEEGVEMVVPIAAIASVTVKKEQEDEESPVKIVLVVKLVSTE